MLQAVSLGALGNSITYNKDVSFLANDYKTFYLNSSTISKLEQIEVVPIVNSGNAEKSCSAIYLDSIPTCSDGSAVIGNGPGQIPEEQIIQVTVPIPTGEPFVDLAYPIFSNYLDNNGTLTVSGKGWFNVTLSNANGTVILEIDNTNITATNLSLNVYNVSYNFISNGTYSYKWYSWGNGTSHNPGVSIAILDMENLSSIPNLLITGPQNSITLYKAPSTPI